MPHHLMKPKPNRTRRNDPDGMRNHVLDVAADLFQARGYHATSINDLLQKAGLSGGALHHHFPTKQSIGLGVINERVAPAVRETWIDPIRTAPSLRKGIASVFEAIVAGLETRGSVSGCPLNNLALELSRHDPEFRRAIDAVFSEWQAAIGERIAKTRGGARLDRAKRADCAAFIISVYSGAMTLAKSSQTASALRSAASFLAQWLRDRDLELQREPVHP
jgi:TetR/AcrR family transcriptional repressor of nem operon